MQRQRLVQYFETPLSLRFVFLPLHMLCRSGKSDSLDLPHTLQNASLSRTDGIWFLSIDDVMGNGSPPPSPLPIQTSLAVDASTVKCRVLVCADGASSSLARSLIGLAPEENPATTLGPPNAIGCRAFAKKHTHDFRADEVLFYPRPLVPGHFRLCGELDDYLCLSLLMVPHPDSTIMTQITPAAAVSQFNRAIDKEQWIRAALGPRRQLTKVQTSPMRVGGVAQSHFPHGLVLGDAAGQQDPLLGDGISYGMKAAQIAAETIVEAFRKNNFSMKMFKRYHNGWKALFGWDFFWFVA
jgi:flavin-dependent dehydrogenase